MIASWPAPPGDTRARHFLFSTHVVTRAGIVHTSRCKTLSRTNLHDVKAAHLDALPNGSRLCRRCLASAPRQLALDFSNSAAPANASRIASRMRDASGGE
jgi:hypothetical protein